MSPFPSLGERPRPPRSNQFEGNFGAFWAAGDPEGGRAGALGTAGARDHLRVLAHIPWLPPALAALREELAPELDLAAFVAGPSGPPGHSMAAVALGDLEGLTLKGVAQYVEVLARLERAFADAMASFSKTLTPLMIRLWTAGGAASGRPGGRPTGLAELGDAALRAADEFARSAAAAEVSAGSGEADARARFRGGRGPVGPGRTPGAPPPEPPERGGGGAEGPAEGPSFSPGDLGEKGRRLLGRPRSLDALLHALVRTGDRGLVRAGGLAAGGAAGVSLVCQFHEESSGTAAAVLSPRHSLPYALAVADGAFRSVCAACEDCASIIEAQPGAASELVTWSRRVVAQVCEACLAWAKHQGPGAGAGLVPTALRAYGLSLEARVPGLEVLSVVEASSR